jgi:hypothetical protein
LGEHLSVGTWPVTAAPTENRIKNGRSLLEACLRERRVPPSSAGTLAGKWRFLGGSLYSRVGYPGLAPLYARQHGSSDGMTLALEMGISWLLEVSRHIGPREWLWGSAAPAPLQLFGDASEPGDSAAPRVCAAILQRPDATTQYFHVAIPGALLALLSPRAKQICVLELLWVIIAVIIWHDVLHDAYLVAYDDNEAARGGIVRGMSSHWDLNVLLAILWGSAAELRCKLWAERVASADNPADCLTKPGLDKSHLQRAIDISGLVDWPPLFAQLQSILAKRTLPRWHEVVEWAHCSRAQGRFQ